MRPARSAIVSIVLATACTSITTNSPSVESNPTSTSAPTPQTTSTTAVPTTTVPSGPPLGWIAPSGVHLAVTGQREGVVEVLTPCGETTSLREGTPLYTVDVVIDPGHGGPVDTGAVAPTGLVEKDVNLRVALAAHDLLAERGISALLTRTADYPIPIPIRSAYADLTGAGALVSIHHNAPTAPSSDIPGVEVFVQHDETESQRLGGLLYESAMDALSQFDVDWDRSPDAGTMTVMNPEGEDAYGMVRLPAVPSALLELGFIANQAEAELYRTPEYVQVAALAITDGVESFLGTNAQGAELVEGRVFDPQPGVGQDQCVEPDLDLSLYPDVLAVEVTEVSDGFSFVVTMSSPYDTPERYADAFRVVGDDGVVYGVRELLHDHASEQPFTRTLSPVSIPGNVTSVTVEGRDQVYGWGGEVVRVELP